MRFVGCLIALAFLSLVPNGDAQTIRITTAWETASVELGETGRTDVPLLVEATIADTVCASDQTYTVGLNPGSFPKWAGASLVPSQATFKVAAGPHPGATALPQQEIALNVAWDLDGAPRLDAVQEYVVRLSPDHVAKSGGPCLPDPVVDTQDSEPLVVAMPDRPGEAEERDCIAEPLQEKCVSTNPTPAPTSSVGTFVGFLVFVAATVFRRRRAA